MPFILNLSSRTVHDANSTDGRCKLHIISDGNKMEFDSFQDALNYLPSGKKATRPCAFCLGKDYETK
jgi:hypothetical protein